MRSPLIAVLVVPLISAAGLAHAEAPAQASDLRCLITMGALASIPADKEPAIIGVYYYAGRITARDPTFDFVRALKPLAAKMTGQEVHEAAKPCAEEVQRTMTALSAAQAAMAPPPK